MKRKPISWRKVILITFTCFIAIAISAVSFILIVTSDSRLDLSKLTESKASTLVITTASGKTITETQKDNSNESINDNTKNAFIAIEDKRFYSHNGIDLKRIGGAIIANIKSGKKSQGGSTITQQLIKNTHLSSTKSFKRKLSEIKLALELERAYSKEEIINAYLNNIYFGNGCIGIKKAASYYFGKKPSDLTISESALLAGLVQAPSATEPKKHFEKANKRKELVLLQMLKQKLITDEEYKEALEEELNFVFKKSNNNIYDIYIDEVKKEACEILNIDQDTLDISSFVIETFAEDEAMICVHDAIKKNKIPDSSSCAIIIDSESGAVKAMASIGTYDFVNGKRQPGSAIKPILVYGPAIEEGIITPESFILDEKTNFGGYKPQNAGDKYSGWISVREALATSKNVPAIKILNMCGVNKSKEYAKRAGISFDENDTSLAIALGGLTQGTTITELAGAYTTFPSGYAKKPHFIKSIKNANGNVIYLSQTESSKVFGEDTAYLVYDMMKDTTKIGTAKTLDNLGFEIAAKTGTVGSENGNTDCYNVSVTSNDICVVMLTSANENSPLSSKITGATIPTNTAKLILSGLYRNIKPKNAELPNSVEYVSIDTRALENQQLKISFNLSSKYAKQMLFSKRHLPTEEYRSMPEKSEIIPEQNSNQRYYSIVGKSKKIIPINLEPTTKELNDILQEIFSL